MPPSAPLLALLLAAPLPAATPERVADGVHVLVHADATDDWPQGNTVLVTPSGPGALKALVVDSGYLPSTAATDAATVRRLAPGGVGFLLNTHWHYDHNLGNAAWADAFPGLALVAHEETRRLMDANARGWPERRRKACAQELEDLRAQLAQVTAGGRAPAPAPAPPGATPSAAPPPTPDALRARIAERERELAELARVRYAPPELTFGSSLVLRLGAREARLLHLGRGNTPGDAVVHLPRERVLVAGDLVVHPVPFGFNSYPTEWARTLRALDALDFDVLVPGHGPPLRDRTYLRQLVALLESLVAQARDAAGRNLTLEETRRAVDLRAVRDPITRGDPAREALFRDVFETPAVERAWREAKGQQ